MKWAFELLGLPMDTDTASIKRAYARLLRTTRPDEDQAGFQRLHTAYKTALAHVSTASAAAPHAAENSAAMIKTGHQSMTDAATPTAAATVTLISPTLANAPHVPMPAVNIPALAEEVIRTATDNGGAKALLQWLQARQEFWSITTKQQTGQLVLHRLFQAPQAMSSDSLDVLLHFFDMDHVLSGINPFALQQLRRRQTMQWELIPRNDYLLAQRTRTLRNGRQDTAAVKRYLDLFRQPLGWRPIVWTVLHYGRARGLGRFVHAFCNGRLDELPPQLNRQHVQFWLQSITQGRMTWPRFAVGSIRAVITALASMLCVAGIFAFSFSMGGIAGREALSSGTTVSIAMAISIVSLWLIYSGWIVLDQWQGLPESATEKQAWLRRAVVPALCALSLMLDYLLDTPLWAALIAVTCLALSARRLWQRRSQKKKPSSFQFGRFKLPIWIIAIAMSHAFADNHTDVLDGVPVVAGLTATALCLWIADMWRHRSYLHPRFARG